MSDVWRDVDWSPGEAPIPLAERLADLFGLPSHRYLQLVDLSLDATLKPESIGPVLPLIAANGTVADLSSQLRQGDCLHILRTLPNNSIDFCFAEPPYN